MLEQRRLPWSWAVAGLLLIIIIIIMIIVGIRIADNNNNDDNDKDRKKGSIGATSIRGQQAYLSNHQLACYDHTYDSLTKGFLCNAPEPSCQAYITFRAHPPYSSPTTIANLLGLDSSSASLIASLNNISSDVGSIPSDTQVVVPVTCSCFNRTYYQHNASYTIKHTTETYFSVANLTYQGLTTCQAMISQNPYDDRNFYVGLDLNVPLRCACPTSNETRADAAKFLLTYMVTWGDSVSSIASTFGVEEKSVRDANQLSPTTIIFPFTPLLVPLTKDPTQIQTAALLSPPSASSPVTPTLPVRGRGSGSSSNNNNWAMVGQDDETKEAMSRHNKKISLYTSYAYVGKQNFSVLFCICSFFIFDKMINYVWYMI